MVEYSAGYREHNRRVAEEMDNSVSEEVRAASELMVSYFDKAVTRPKAEPANPPVDQQPKKPI